MFSAMFSGGSPATGHRGYHRGLAGFSAGFSSILRKRVCCPFHGHAGTVSEASAPAPTRPGPFLSEIPQNPRLFWVEFGCDPPAPSLALGLNKAQHGAAATLPFVGAANHRGPLQMSGFVRLSRYALLLGHRCKR
jgi:hypothetical protein